MRIASSSLPEAGRFSSASWFRGGQAYREKGTGETWKGCGSRQASAQVQLRQSGLCLCVDPGTALFRSTSFVCCVFNLCLWLEEFNYYLWCPRNRQRRRVALPGWHSISSGAGPLPQGTSWRQTSAEVPSPVLAQDMFQDRHAQFLCTLPA